MAKKSTWEKRAKKVKKEEYLVLGGRNKKRSASTSKSDNEGSDSDKPRKSGGKTYGGSNTRGKSGSSSRPPRGSKPAPREEGSDEQRPEKSGGKSYSGSGNRGKSSGTSRPQRGSKSAPREEGSSDHKPRTRGGNSFDGPKFRGKHSGDKFHSDRSNQGEREEGSNDKFRNRGNADKQFRSNDRKKSYGKFQKDKPFDGFKKERPKQTEDIRLNKYLSMAGVASRREADKFIEQGMVTINGTVVTELGTKVKPKDVVEFAGEKVKAEALRYVLLNKPKDCITTLSDERGRSTVIGLVKNACNERIYPVGRLDRNTTGLLLLTNDGELADKLAHPSNDIRKVYHVITDKNVTIADLKKLETGVQLDDGMAKADAALFAGDGSVRNEIGLEIHSGKNRVVRRMFEALGYQVTRLDRAAFAGLSKKGLPRGRWRFLTEKEISYLKML